MGEEEYAVVVVKDMCKGVVSSQLIATLAEVLPTAHWFVSSKAWEPEWLKHLYNVDLRLLLIPQVAAARAVERGLVGCWITRSGNASKDALRTLDGIATRFHQPPGFVVLPGGSSVLARIPNDNGIRGLVQKEVAADKLAVGVPMASVFFPALLTKMLFDNPAEQEQALKDSLAFTRDWRRFEANRVVSYESWNPKNAPVLGDHEPASIAQPISWQSFDWAEALQDWGDAFSGHFNGVITKGTTRKLELWRAMTEIDGYVCCVKSKREVLRKINKEIADFEREGRRKHRSCMVIARPGSGKTHLVRCLAKGVRLRLLSFNITQMLSKSDILDCFDTIATTQAQNKEEGVLVFVDEMNAMLSNQHVYDTFLAPLEEGRYVRAGKTFQIDPCVWIFAGTDSPETRDPDRNRATKASDFVSRLTLKTLNLTISSTDAEEARMEKVYLGAALLQATFPDVRKVSGNVLNLFHILNTDFEVREVAHLVASFTNIQYGEVTSANVPDDWLREHREAGVDPGPWRRAELGDLVEIVRE